MGVFKKDPILGTFKKKQILMNLVDFKNLPQKKLENLGSL